MKQKQTKGGCFSAALFIERRSFDLPCIIAGHCPRLQMRQMISRFASRMLPKAIYATAAAGATCAADAVLGVATLPSGRDFTGVGLLVAEKNAEHRSGNISAPAISLAQVSTMSGHLVWSLGSLRADPARNILSLKLDILAAVRLSVVGHSSGRRAARSGDQDEFGWIAGACLAIGAY